MAFPYSYYLIDFIRILQQLRRAAGNRTTARRPDISGNVILTSSSYAFPLAARLTALHTSLDGSAN
jgi:hypothetical protein